MARPLVSVIMSVYRDRGALRQSIDSVLRQSFEDLELIAINDASPDDAGETLKAVQSCDPRVRIIENEFNLGLTKSLNRGLEAARGRFVARIDEGDIWLDDKLKSQAAFLEHNEDFVLVGSRYRHHLPGGDVVPATKLPADDRAVRDWLFCGLTPMAHSAILFRNGTIKYNPRAKTSQDFDLCLRLSLLGRMCNLPQEMLSMLLTSDGISSQKEEMQFFDHLQMHTQFLAVLRGRIEREQFVLHGTEFPEESSLLSLRRRYMGACLRMLNGIGNRRSRRVLKNIFIPDMLLYQVRKRSAPYLFRATYDAWVAGDVA